MKFLCNHCTIIKLLVPFQQDCLTYNHRFHAFTDSTDKVIKIIDTVVQSIGTKGTWAIDRMGDNNEIIKCFTGKKLQFVTRLKLNRWLYMHNKNGGKIMVQTERMDRHMHLTH